MEAVTGSPAMRAAVLHAPRSLRVESRPAPAAGPGEVVVRVRATGLCGTDYRIWAGDRPVAYPRVMGHEFFGAVAEVGAGVTGLAAGQRVAVEPNYSCGECPLCREGNKNLCRRRTAVGIDVDGGFADLARVPVRCCWPAPDAPDDQLLLTEPLAVVVRAVRRGEPRAGEAAAVIGVGTLGLLAVQVLKAAGLRVLAVSRSARRLDHARAVGADQVATTGEAEEAGRALSGREGVGLVIETAGTPEAVGQAVDLCRPGGTVVLAGLPHAPTSLDFFSVVRREIRILGSMIYQDEFPEAMRLLASGAVRTDRLLTHRFPLERIQEAFEAHRASDAIKVAVDLAGT
jgi:2-desacetyl-2-hydroxyethyl bacteriochlorophyllide A dehydrogenase